MGKAHPNPRPHHIQSIQAPASKLVRIEYQNAKNRTKKSSGKILPLDL